MLRHPLIAHSELELLEAAGLRTSSTEAPVQDPLPPENNFVWSTAPQRTPDAQHILPDLRWMKNVATKKCGESRAAKNPLNPYMASHPPESGCGIGTGWPWWSQAVDATLYLRRKRWSGQRWVEDMFEDSTRPRRSCGTAGGAHSQLNRVAWQLNERSRETLGFETRAERD